MHQPCGPILHHPSKHIESHLRIGTQLWPARKARTIFVQQVSSAGISEPAARPLSRCRFLASDGSRVRPSCEPGAIIRDLRSLLTRLSLRLTVLVECSVEFASRCGLIAEIKVEAVHLFQY